MKFLADENVDKPIVERLRKDGNVVIYVAEVEPSISDDEVIKLANQESALLLTEDKDFGELTFLQHKVKSGILLLRFQTEDTKYKIDTIRKVFEQYQNKIPLHFLVISETKIRIRPI